MECTTSGMVLGGSGRACGRGRVGQRLAPVAAAPALAPAGPSASSAPAAGQTVWAGEGARLQIGRWRGGLAAVLGAVALAAMASPAGAAHTLYVTNSGSGNVSAFSIGANGALSAVPGSPFSVGTSPFAVAVTPDGRHVYVTNGGSGTVSLFSIGVNGALSVGPVPFFNAGSNPTGVAVTPDGRYLYVANEGSKNVSAFSIGANGLLGAVPGSPFETASNGQFGPFGLAVTPDGRNLYAPNYSANNVSAFSIGANGALSAVPGSPFGAGELPFAVVVTPDGRDLYVTNVGSGNVSAFSVGANGALSAVPGSPFHASPTPEGAPAVTPDGAHLYVPDPNFSTLSAFSIGANGALSAVSGSPFSTGSGTYGVAVTPDSRDLYVANVGGVSAFSIGADGAPSVISGSPFSAGTNPLEVAVTPDQGPAAAFSASAAPAGSASAFNGLASADPDGTVVRYDWSFGDGTSAPNGGPTPTHIYATRGSYAVTLTVTDDAGCSTARTFTGQTVSCNGSAAAQVSHQLTVPSGPPPIPQRPSSSSSPPLLSALTVSPRTFGLAGRRVRGRCVASTPANRRHHRCKRAIKLRIAYQLNAPAHVSITIARQLPGRLAGGRCVKPTRKNRKHRPCTRSIALSGVITANGRPGANTVIFNGRIGGHNLTAGKYRLTATPSANGQTGSSRTVAFTISTG
jgi:DNA-binding beta-propeller fold protein YncE